MAGDAKPFKEFMRELTKKTEGYFLFTPAEGDSDATVEFSRKKPKPTGNQIIGTVQLDEDRVYIAGKKLTAPNLNMIRKAFKAATVKEVFLTPEEAAELGIGDRVKIGNDQDVAEADDTDENKNGASSSTGETPKNQVDASLSRIGEQIAKILPRWPKIFDALLKSRLPPELTKALMSVDAILRPKGVSAPTSDDLLDHYGNKAADLLSAALSEFEDLRTYMQEMAIRASSATANDDDDDNGDDDDRPPTDKRRAATAAAPDALATLAARFEKILPAWPKLYNALFSSSPNDAVKNDMFKLDRIFRGSGEKMLTIAQIIEIQGNRAEAVLTDAQTIFMKLAAWSKDNPVEAAAVSSTPAPPPTGASEYERVDADAMLPSAGAASAQASPYGATPPVLTETEVRAKAAVLEERWTKVIEPILGALATTGTAPAATITQQAAEFRKCLAGDMQALRRALDILKAFIGLKDAMEKKIKA